MIRITPLDGWAAQRIGGDLRAYQLEKVNETLKTAQNGTYYRKTLPPCVDSLAEFFSLPTIDSGTLTQNGTGLVCVPQTEIARVVTLPTSGTTGTPKRVYFTERDQELTVDYFAHGLQTVTNPVGTMAILLPSERPGGVGDLIARALARIPVTPVRYGQVTDLAGCAETLRRSGADSLVGVPVQVLTLARYCAARGIKLGLRGVLLSTDNIPRVVIREIERIWNCEVYEHYGMTEMGLGGAIDCDVHDGCHIRENDLLFEVLDEAGNRLPDGVSGELAFTTLTRHGMPFIRYRTGDISKILPGTCKCGSALRRIAPVSGRIGGEVLTECGTVVKLREYDEVLFSIPQVCGYSLTAYTEKNYIKLEVETQRSVGDVAAGEVLRILAESGLPRGLEIETSVARQSDTLPAGGGKRSVTVIRE